MLSSLLSVLLLSAKRLYIPENNYGRKMPFRSDLTRRFKSSVEKNFMSVKSVNKYARLLNISSGHLNDMVHQDTGRTASEIIHERIILEAKRLLYRSEKSVKEIAFAIGYDDPSYFVKFFKVRAGITPDQFRKHIREKYH
jgi:AraC-like DNA-binding protein